MCLSFRSPLRHTRGPKRNGCRSDRAHTAGASVARRRGPVVTDRRARRIRGRTDPCWRLRGTTRRGVWSPQRQHLTAGDCEARLRPTTGCVRSRHHRGRSATARRPCDCGVAWGDVRPGHRERRRFVRASCAAQRPVVHPSPAGQSAARHGHGGAHRRTVVADRSDVGFGGQRHCRAHRGRALTFGGGVRRFSAGAFIAPLETSRRGPTRPASPPARSAKARRRRRHATASRR